MYRTSSSPRAYRLAAGIRRTPVAPRFPPLPVLRPTLRPCALSFRARYFAIPQPAARDAGPSFARLTNRKLPPPSVVFFPCANRATVPVRAPPARPPLLLLPDRAAALSCAFPRVLKFLPRACGIHRAPLPSARVRLLFFPQ